MELNLKKVSAYAVYSSDDERSGSIKGYYKDYNAASVKAKGSGWYGSDGEVKTVNVWMDEEGKIYDVKPLGKYTDDAEKYRQETMESIKSKLTKEELELLGVK